MFQEKLVIALHALLFFPPRLQTTFKTIVPSSVWVYLCTRFIPVFVVTSNEVHRKVLTCLTTVFMVTSSKLALSRIFFIKLFNSLSYVEKNIDEINAKINKLPSPYTKTIKYENSSLTYCRGLWLLLFCKWFFITLFFTLFI